MQKKRRVIIVHLKQDRIYTEEDWLNLREGENAELIDGNLIMLASPTWEHQTIVTNIAAEFRYKLKGTDCRVYPAPCGVKLSEKDNNIYEPDLFVVCGKNYDRKKHFNIVKPKLIIEILSPSTGRYDKTRKFMRYINAGIEEIWIVNIADEEPYITVYLKEDDYVGEVHEKNDKIRTMCDIYINLIDIFDGLQ
jgi:Uma2 family endonuclease